MKYLLVFIHFFLSFASYSQDYFKSKADSINALSQKWKLVKNLVDGESQPSLSDSKDFVIFKKDGIHQFIMDNQSWSGKWTLDTKQHFLSTEDEGGILKWKIIKLSRTQLVLETNRNEQNVQMTLRTGD